MAKIHPQSFRIDKECLHKLNVCLAVTKKTKPDLFEAMVSKTYVELQQTCPRMVSAAERDLANAA